MKNVYVLLNGHVIGDSVLEVGTHTEEAWLMEQLADEEGIPDDGELEGSGDDFEG